MGYDERLAERVRDTVATQVDPARVTERKMFGGLCVMLSGNMCCGVIGNELMVRVGPDAYPRALGRKHAREMDFTGRALKGMVYVSAAGVKGRGLASWTKLGVEFAASLPPK